MGLSAKESANLAGLRASGKEMANQGDKEYAANLEAGAREREVRAQTHGKQMRKTYGTDMDGLEEVLSPIEHSKIDSEIGQSAGVSANLQKNPGIYVRNAEYGEKSKQQFTAAKIHTLGGIDSAVAADVAAASLKSAGDLGAVTGDIAAALEANGFSKEEARRLAEQMVANPEGLESADGAKALAQKTKTAMGLAAARMLSDSKRINEYGSTMDFAGAAARKALSDETKNKAVYDASNSQSVTSNIIAEEMKQFANAGALDEYIRDGLRYGFLEKDENGNIRAATGDAWVRGRAMAGAGDMARDHNLVAGGRRFNTDFNPFTGDAITNINGVRRIEEGNVVNANLGAPESIDAAKKKEMAEMAASPLTKGLPALIGKSYDEAKAWFQDHKFSEEAAAYLAGGAVGLEGVVTAAGIVETGQRIVNFARASYVDRETGKLVKPGDRVPTGAFDPETGKPIMKEVSREELRSSKRFKVEGGTPSKFLGGLFERGGKDATEIENRLDPASVSQESTNKTSHEPSDISQSSQHERPDHSVEQKSQHLEPPSDDLSSNSTTERSTAQPSQRQQELDLEKKAKREAAGRWLDNRMKNQGLLDDKYLDSLDSRSQNRARAKRQYFERAMKHLESHGNLDDLDIFTKEAIGYDDNAKTRIGKIADHMLEHGQVDLGGERRPLPDAGEAKLRPHAPAAGGSWRGSLLKSVAALVGLEAASNVSETMENMIDLVSMFNPLGFLMGQPLGEGSDLPVVTGTGPVPGTTPVNFSSAAAQALSDPGASTNWAQNQVAQIHHQQAQTRALENLSMLQQFANPVAPAPGITLQTSGGEIPITTTPQGTVAIGGYQTGVPAQEFRSYMQDSGNAQAFANMMSTSSLNRDTVYENLHQFEKKDTGRMEGLLDVMKQTSYQQKDDQRVGLYTVMDHNEKIVEATSAMAEHMEKLAESLGESLPRQ